MTSSFSDEIFFLDPETIKIPPGRQRSDVKIEDLADGIREVGQINPIIVRKDGEDFFLVAGGRRLEACRLLKSPIAARIYTPPETLGSEVVELEENIKREDLPWRDRVNAIGRLHTLYKTQNPDWRLEDTSKKISLGVGRLRDYLFVYASVDSPRLVAANSFTQALGILQRFAERRAEAIVADIAAGGNTLFGEPPKPELEITTDLNFKPKEATETVSENDDSEPLTESGINNESKTDSSASNEPKSKTDASWANDSCGMTDSNTKNEPGASTEPQSKNDPPATAKSQVHDNPIACADFLTWVEAYRGPSFNFIHCDFPYGVNTEDSLIETYENTPKIYESLFSCLLDNIPKLLSHSSHLMFWLNMRFYDDAKIRLRKAGLHVIDRPIIWLKSDSRGAAPGLKGTQPRHVYEAALLCSRGQRPLVKQFGDGYPAPNVSNPIHPTQKPEPMLKYFFAGLIDETTNFFDPTAGSGASIRAAEDMGARTVLGLELDPHYCAAANAQCARARLLRLAGR